MEYQERRFAELFDIKLLKSQSVLKPQLLNEGVVIGSEGNLYIDYCTDEYQFPNVILFLKNKSQDVVLAKYAYYYLLANQDSLDRVFKCMKRKLTRQLFSCMSIKYPPMIEQYEIVQKLDIVHNSYDWQLKAYANLIHFPCSYYLRMKKASNMMWNKNVKLGKLVNIRLGKKCKERDFLNVRVNGNNIEIYGKSKVILTVEKDKCNPYFLACMLPTHNLFRMLEHFTIENKIPIMQMETICVKLPTKREQQHLEELFKKVEVVKNDMLDAIKQIKVLRDYYLHYYLYRKSFGHNLSLLDEKEIVKYSYTTPAMIDSLQTYDALRAELYKSLLCGDNEQYFDATTNSVKIRKKS